MSKKGPVYTFDTLYTPQIKRKGFPFHVTNESWDYGRLHALPLWTEYVLYPIIHPKGYSFSQNVMTTSSFEYILEGRMVIEQDESRTVLVPGDLCLIPAGSRKNLIIEEECRRLVVGFCGQLHLPLLAMTGILSKGFIHIKNDKRMVAVIRELHRMLREKSEDDIPHIVALTMELVMEISRMVESALPPLLANTLNFLECNLSEEVRIADVAARLHASMDFLNRLFRKELGVSPKRWLIDRRMQLAVILLKDSDLSIQEISQKCGYGNQFVFSREFRKKYDCSPLMYRKKSHNEKKGITSTEKDIKSQNSPLVKITFLLYNIRQNNISKERNYRDPQEKTNASHGVYPCGAPRGNCRDRHPGRHASPRPELGKRKSA